MAGGFIRINQGFQLPIQNRLARLVGRACLLFGTLLAIPRKRQELIDNASASRSQPFIPLIYRYFQIKAVCFLSSIPKSSCRI